jgi:hypothetical protein
MNNKSNCKNNSNQNKLEKINQIIKTIFSKNKEF